ncbi:MAG: DUF4332 domain-containing protein, partial [Anaerolineales bacterium]|nr:DUF4332 domain-containing protein [Anaerolineales bacterium]
MYSINLEKITIDEFKEILTTVDLLPGRRILLEDLSGVVERLKKKGFRHLADLQEMLKDKKQYPALAEEYAVSIDYLIILNREINSYQSKPLPLGKLGVFSEAEQKRLEGAGLKTTRDLYEQGLTRPARAMIARQAGISETQLAAALELSDLLRITGVGPVYARMLRETGVKSVSDFSTRSTADILSQYQRLNQEKNITQVNLGTKDIEYCKRFSQKLDIEVD